MTATSPGEWANGGRVTIWYRSAVGAALPAEVDVRVAVPAEPVEVFTGIRTDQIAERTRDSRLVRFEPAPPGLAAGASKIIRNELSLSGGRDAAPDVGNYLAAVSALADQPEVAIVAVPDLGAHLSADADRHDVVSALLSAAASRLDQLVLLDVPADKADPTDALPWAASLPGDPALRRAGAVYYPGLLVPDPLGGLAAPLRAIPPSGHVAGVISRLDRERGAFYTPANAPLEEAVDLQTPLTGSEQHAVFAAGLNLLRCTPGRGLQVWGGRTLDPGRRHRYLAHRRLLHRLVRAIRRVADPLVFDVNGPELRLSLVRAVTSVLLAAFRSGALAGASPQDAFRVTCDGTNNPAGADPGQVVCDIAVAPVVPMEFIRLRLLVSQQSQLEVTET